jgi:CheY-like chemotaxis protein
MPGLEGAAFAQRLRAACAPGTAPRLVQLSLGDGPAGAARFEGHIVKPVTFDKLQAMLGQLRLPPGPALDGGDGPAREPGASRRERPGLLGLRVLLAEDNPVNQEVAVELLREVGAQVDVVADGIEAVAHAQTRAYDLILMDVQMPRMDGLHATALIRREPAHLRTPILAMTANAFDDDRDACLAAGMNDHIAKPVDPQQLYATMARWTQGDAGTRQALDESVWRASQFGADELGAELAPPPAAHELDHFEQLLAQGDFEAGARYRELGPGLLAHFGAAARPIGAHLRRHDYAGALQALRALRAPRATPLAEPGATVPTPSPAR